VVAHLPLDRVLGLVGAVQSGPQAVREVACQLGMDRPDAFHCITESLVDRLAGTLRRIAEAA
jgi:hypothetical protein